MCTYSTSAQYTFREPTYAVQTTYSIPFDTVINFRGKEQVLRMDIYEPVDSNKRIRPTLLMCFGGGFYWGDKNNYSMETICNRLAQMGYVTISIDYRTRWKRNQSEIDKGGKTLYRAVQDLSNAMRFIENQIHNGNPWNIDDKQFFLGGNSSGALTVFNYHFNEANEASIFAPYYTELGHWKKSNIKPKALINLCGAISDTNLIQTPTPILSMHGDEDNIVPYKSATVDFRLPMVTTFPQVLLHGSYWIHRRSCNLGANSFLYTYEHQRHSPFDKMLEPKLYVANMDVTLTLMSNFLHNQTHLDSVSLSVSEIQKTHLSECSIEIQPDYWRFYPVNKWIKKVFIKVEDSEGNKLYRKRIKKKLKVFTYSPKLKPGKYTLKVAYGNFQKSTPIEIE